MLTLALEDAQPDRNEQGACLQHRQYPQPEALVMSLGILLVPNVPRKPGAQVQQGHHSSDQGMCGRLPQQANFAQQGIQRGAVHRQHGGVALAGPGQHREQRALARLPASLQRGQEGLQHLTRSRNPRSR